MHDSVLNDEGFDESLDDLKFRMAPDPFGCILQKEVQTGESSYLKQLYSPLLEGLDPTFQLVTINENDGFGFPKAADEDDVLIDSSILYCPALSIVLFLSEDFGRLSAKTLQENFNISPWEFHHRVELPRHAKPRVTAGQDFYATFPNLPLWSICPVHYGNEHLRFHIFVKDFMAMRLFYEIVTGKKATSGSSGFCFFTMYSQSGFDLQLSLKYMPQILPHPSNSVHLKFKVKDINAIMDAFSETPVRKGDALWVVKDPDGNSILIEETEATSLTRTKGQLSSNISLETSDYETASIDTESLAGSINISPQGSLNSTFSALSSSLS